MPVVYTTKTPNVDAPGHVVVRINGQPTVAICEKVWNVREEQLGSFAGACSAAEMSQIDIALSCVFGLDEFFGGAVSEAAVPAGVTDADDADLEELEKELEMVTNQLDVITEQLEKITDDRNKLNELYINLTKEYHELESENERLERNKNRLELDVVRMTERADIYESQFRTLMKQVMDGKGEHDGT